MVTYAIILLIRDDVMENLYEWIMNMIQNIGMYSIAINCLLIVVESIIPPLPLSLFITILFVNYGSFLGFLISWIFTVIGCVISFYLFQTVFKKFIDRKIRTHEFANKFLKIIDTIKFNNLVLIIAMPFTPAFLVNIVAGVSNMNIKKFLPAILIGKISLVIFWGYIGTTLLESLNNPMVIIKVIILMIAAYVISKVVNKKFNLD